MPLIYSAMNRCGDSFGPGCDFFENASQDVAHGFDCLMPILSIFVSPHIVIFLSSSEFPYLLFSFLISLLSLPQLPFNILRVRLFLHRGWSLGFYMDLTVNFGGC